MAIDRLSLADALGAFAPGQPLRAAFFLTYSFDGRWFEEVVAPILFDRPVAAALVLRDRNALLAEAPSVRYHRADAASGVRVFHPKLALFVAEDRARAVVGSANLTRGGFERNLELGSVFDLTPDGGPRSVFESLLAYLAVPLRGETAGGGLAALDDVTSALREVIEQSPTEAEPSPHALLHNYERPLWDQLLEQLPHRVLRRALVVSPFYEPDTAGGPEDPPGQAADDSAFGRLFADFEFEPETGEKPVAVCFEEDSGVTGLPVVKLRAWEDRLDLRHRLATSDDARRLHAKLLVLEGRGGKGRDPFLFALHGSPNFTSAALHRRPPDGNAELAVLTRLPARGGGATRVAKSLALDALFGSVTDWNTLKSAPPAPAPQFRGASDFAVVDVTLKLGGRAVTVSVRNVPAGATRFRLSALIDGAWVQVAEGAVGADGTVEIAAPLLATAHASTGLLTLRAARVRLEVFTAEGAALGADEAPLNVDCPEQFCGLAMVGPLLLTLDQRIAQAGAGVPMTYREQQRWLERLRQQQAGAPAGLALPSHQADLDKFFRNLHTGLRGLRRRQEASPRSEFVLRNALRQFGKWCAEAVDPDAKVATAECRVFLLDRLSREMAAALGRAAEVPSAAKGLGLVSAADHALEWLAANEAPDTTEYVTETRARFVKVRRAAKKLEALT